MLEKMKAYIDSFEEITILVDKDINTRYKTFYLLNGDEKITLEIKYCQEEYSFFKYVVNTVDVICLRNEYYIVDNDDNKCLLRSGSVIRTQAFEARYKYDGPLGCEYSKNKTVFRVWSPVAKELYLELYHDNITETIPFVYKDKGLWECEVKKDIDGYGYLLKVRVFEEFKKIHDPYAFSSSANGEYNYVIDFNKLYKMKYNKPEFSGTYTDAVIYEASIRDFTYYLNNSNQGTFLGMIENHPTKQGATGIQYIASLGVTHLQLLPIFDFGGVDDINKDSFYNWGYNPEQYFVPCGWYSKNPNDPYSRINELLMLVDECHKYGIRVNMDVVFNHVYKYEEFSLDFLVPGYNYRVGLDGKMSNASFCGNDFASERYMCSRFICDALDYYAKVFNMSGFRFDLMGLLDINTLNNAYKRLSKIDDKIILYGEGWNMDNPLPNEKRPHMFNHHKVPQYGFFNDRFRDFIRGSQFEKAPGYAFGNEKSIYDLYHLVFGSCLDYFKFSQPVQSLNYVECHDNYTFYDYGKTYLKLDDNKIFDASRLALSLVIISQGIPFIHAGEEFYRSKQGVENSYNTKDEINKIDYARRDKYISMVNTTRDLISIRKEYETFRLANACSLKEKIHFLEGFIDKNTFAYIMDDICPLYVIIKNDYSSKTVDLDDITMIFDGFKKCDIKKNTFEIKKPGVYIFKGVKQKWN